jgi:hypothetical protein
MKLMKPENENYAATVVAIKSITPLEGSDNIVGTPLFGFQAIVGKDTNIDDVGIVFPAEAQLSSEYCYENNLHQHGNLNKDEGAKGYLGDNRRVRAIRLRGHRSDCLFMPLSSLSYIKGFNPSDLAVGDVFDAIGDNPICKKYVIQRTVKEQRIEKNKNKFIRVDKKFMPEHYDSDNYFRNVDVIPEGKPVVITQKLHGTSIRIGNTVVARKLNLLETLAKRLGVKVAETEHDYVYGSRKVIKDINNPNQNHFYSTDIWTEEGEKLKGMLPEGYVVYGELIGWTAGGAPIQRHYTYGVPQSTADLFVYRVAHINPQGIITDLSWDQTVEFCGDRGLNTVPELWRGAMPNEEFIRHLFIDKKFREEGYPQAVPLDPESPVDEGVCIRVDGIAPYILKAKSPLFFEHETKMLDEEALDLEAEGSVT